MRTRLLQKLAKLPVDVIRKGGKPLAVIRPNDPKLALDLARKAVDGNDKALLDRIPAEAEEKGVNYTFVGWLVRRRGKALAVDNAGNNPRDVKPGDSFVTLTEGEVDEKADA
jgi:hypothetical protein